MGVSKSNTIQSTNQAGCPVSPPQMYHPRKRKVYGNGCEVARSPLLVVANLKNWYVMLLPSRHSPPYCPHRAVRRGCQTSITSLPTQPIINQEQSSYRVKHSSEVQQQQTSLHRHPVSPAHNGLHIKEATACFTVTAWSVRIDILPYAQSHGQHLCREPKP